MLSEIANQIEIFHHLGIVLIIVSGALIGCSLILPIKERYEIVEYPIDWEQLLPSNNSLMVIASTLFAVSLIFVAVGDQSRVQTEQMISSSILAIDENHDKIKITNEITKKTIVDNSYVYNQNMWQAAFTGQLALTFLLITAIRSTKTQSAAIMSRYLLVACIIAFALWVVSSIQSIGISGSVTDPPTIPIIPKPF